MIAACFILLAAAICAAWLPPFRAGRLTIAPWLLLLALATLTGLAAHVLTWAAVASLLILLALAAACNSGSLPRWGHCICLALLLIWSLALAMHLLPGFHNVLLLDKVQLSPEAAPFTQYANFDKGAVGLVLLAMLCKQSRSAAEWRRTLLAALPVTLATIAIVLGAGLALGYIRFAPGCTSYTPMFLAVNLFFTCVAEEAFFRGLVQERIAASIANQKMATVSAVAASALLFGLAHAGGGTRLVLFATLAGLGYALAYRLTRRIEAPVVAHVCLNAVHFTCFTYPFVL